MKTADLNPDSNTLNSGFGHMYRAHTHTHSTIWFVIHEFFKSFNLYYTYKQRNECVNELPSQREN